MKNNETLNEGLLYRVGSESDLCEFSKIVCLMKLLLMLGKEGDLAVAGNSDGTFSKLEPVKTLDMTIAQYA